MNDIWLPSIMIRIVAGRRDALEEWKRAKWSQSAVVRAAALLMLHPDPDPLALVWVSLELPHVPAPLQRRVEAAAPHAATILAQNPQLLHAAKISFGIKHLAERLALPAVFADEQAQDALISIICDDPQTCWSIAAQMSAAWNQQISMRNQHIVQTTLLANPFIAALAAADMWESLNDAQRDAFLAVIVGDASASQAFIMHACPDHRAALSDRWHQALAHAMIANPTQAPLGIAHVWSRLDDDQRVQVVHAVARSAESASAIMRRIKADGWRRLPATEQRMLLDAVQADPLQEAYSVAAIWGALDHDQQATFIRKMQDSPYAVHFLVHMSEDDRCALDARDREALVAATLRQPAADALMAWAVAWHALDESQRDRVIVAVRQHPNLAAELIAKIGAHKWRAMTESQQNALFAAVLDSDYAAARLGIIWSDLATAQQSTVIAAIVASSKSSASSSAGVLLQLINDHHPSALRPEHRMALFRSMMNHPRTLARYAHLAWRASDRSEQDQAIAIVASHAELAALFVQQLTDDDWSNLAPEHRSALLTSVLSHPEASAHVALARYDGLRQEERRALFRAIAGEEGAIAVAYMLKRGADWQPWMHDVAPNATSSAAVKAAWSKAAASLLKQGRPWVAWMESCMPDDSSPESVLMAWRGAAHLVPYPHLLRMPGGSGLRR